MPEPVAAMISDVLRDKTARVAAFGEQSALDLPFEVAAKTGTSKGYRDNWTVGFTREVTVGVWVGNFDGSPMEHVSGITGAAPLFAASMASAMRRFADAEVARKERRSTVGLERTRVCVLSGGAPGPGCTRVVDELVPVGRSPATCEMHETVKIDVRNGLLATPSCPVRFVVERVFERFDGPYGGWAHSAGRDRAPEETSPLCGDRLPYDRPLISSARRPSTVAIRSPRDGARFVLDPDRPRAAQSIGLTVDAPVSAPVTLYVDGRIAGKSRSGAVIHWPIERGTHAIVAESDGRRSDEIRIVVE